MESDIKTQEAQVRDEAKEKSHAMLLYNLTPHLLRIMSNTDPELVGARAMSGYAVWPKEIFSGIYGPRAGVEK